jgi:hypothetical protein
LQGQLDFAGSFEGNITAPPPRSGTHGTICSNLIVAKVSYTIKLTMILVIDQSFKVNDFCGVGVAFSAKVSSFPFVTNPGRRFSTLQFAEAYGLGFPVS